MRPAQFLLEELLWRHMKQARQGEVYLNDVHAHGVFEEIYRPVIDRYFEKNATPLHPHWHAISIKKSRVKSLLRE